MVIFIITTLELGGAQKVCLGLFQALSKTGQAVLIAGKGGQLDQLWQHHPNVILLDSLQNTFSLFCWRQDLAALWQLYKIIGQQKAQNPDLVVHTHSTKAGLFGRFAAMLAGVKKIVHTVHGFGFNAQQPRLKFWLFWLLEKFCSWFTWRYVFVSNADLDYACQRFKINPGKTVLIRASAMHFPALSFAASAVYGSQPLRLASRRIIIGTVSCFKPQKNLLVLLEAFGRLAKRLERKYPGCFQLELQLVGDGQQREQLIHWTRASGLAENIKFLGWCQDLTQFYRQIDIFALSSLWEGLPCSAVEALLFEKPVVAFNVGGLKEIVKDGQNGFLVPPGELFLLSQKLELMILQLRQPRAVQFDQALAQEFMPETALALHQKLYWQKF